MNSRIPARIYGELITKEGNRLMSAAPGQPQSELFPEAANSFFLKDADAQFTFVRDEAGKVVQVNIRRTTRELKAKRSNRVGRD